MRAVIQRVSRAEITIDHQETREIGQGLVVFLGVMKATQRPRRSSWRKRPRACGFSPTKTAR